MGLLEHDFPGSAVRGVRYHKASKSYVAEIGYHLMHRIGADGTVTTKRVRTTHYLGDQRSREEAEVRFESLKRDWVGYAAEQRKAFDAENERRRSRGEKRLPRFKPVWSKVTRRRERAKPIKPTLLAHFAGRLPPTVPGYAAPPLVHPILTLTIRQARDRYVADLKKRIGLQGGKGINANTFRGTSSSLDLALALNSTYTRKIRPIDVTRRLGDLTLDDFEAFVRFWLDPKILKSTRTALNYISTFRQMLMKLKVPRPEGFDDVFKVKIRRARNIAAYDPALLKILLNCTDERSRMVSLLCLNCGFYGVDIARLRPEDITDAEGRRQEKGHFGHARMIAAAMARLRSRPATITVSGQSR